MAVQDAEQQWIRDSLNGNEAAFAALIQEYQRMIHALAYRMCGSLDTAEDIAQETFVRAFHQLHQFRAESRFSTWLCRIAINTCLNWRQREQRRIEVHERWAAETYVASAAAPDPDDVSLKIQSALDKLPPKQRAAVVLTIYEGMNHAEAARVLGCSETTISWRVFVARNKLRRLLSALKPPGK
jgi:RNA polymerase sigma-70 factor (ECF subfamily)